MYVSLYNIYIYKYQWIEIYIYIYRSSSWRSKVPVFRIRKGKLDKHRGIPSCFIEGWCCDYFARYVAMFRRPCILFLFHWLSQNPSTFCVILCYSFLRNGSLLVHVGSYHRHASQSFVWHPCEVMAWKKCVEGWDSDEKKRTQHVDDTIMLMATRNPAHQLRLGVFSKYLQGFIHPRWLAGFLNHQQYHVDSVG